MSSGKLYIIATPIGNLADMTFRAVETLKQVDIVLSEDTRETGKIFAKYSIDKPQISYRDQNHQAVLPKIMQLLGLGQNAALVTDSGTPLISDPGYKLVRDLIDQGIEVESIPGPSAVISALVVSGLPTDKFSFLGFLPRTESHRRALLSKYGALDATLVIYESPFRVKKLLDDISETLGDRPVVVAGELTKAHEKVLRGRVSEVKLSFSERAPKGEFVILVSKNLED
jgi:16S rRNA (cytidine1402-2'-O)-methyltransferase